MQIWVSLISCSFEIERSLTKRFTQNYHVIYHANLLYDLGNHPSGAPEFIIRQGKIQTRQTMSLNYFGFTDLRGCIAVNPWSLGGADCSSLDAHV